MKVNPKNGIDQLLFGMRLPDVIAIYGQPDKQYKDEDENAIALFNQSKMRLTFYMEEDFRLGYIIASDATLELFGNKIIGRSHAAVKNELHEQGLQKWTKEGYDTYENWFNEDHWLVLQTEFDEIVKVELGAIINDKDEFDWKFKTK
ncbi:hypothetical protein [Flavobacterium caeni]|uniref:Uncharacterized protein n=1 Tax=Flavobacterium caeni TaxID=490189 RepID=A0A1G5JKN7_9FLAO|nr:hypothetical protein [Flavobacterium caeni]SCY88450.1 hypothetical protein SAMN02927903_02748 [Flavobacterium caeni]